MKSTTFRFSTAIFALGLCTLVLTGMRCNGYKPAEPPVQPQIPTYTYKTVVGKVTWPSKDSIDQTALAAIPAEEREKLKLSGVPVLVPKDPKFLAVSRVFRPDENGYSFGPADWTDGLDITISGGHVGDASDAPVPERLYEPSPDGVDIGEFKNVTLDQNESGTWYGTWGGYGQVGYLINLHCQKSDDSRCDDRTYLTELIKSLVFVGGNFIPYETTILDK